jgi:hypothetical protein
MNQPAFKSFEKASMVPESILPSNQKSPYNITYNINKEETNVYPLCVSRTPQNFGKHIYIIYSDDISNINRCLTYLQRLTKTSFIEGSLDTLKSFNENDYKKENIYTFNLLKNDIKSNNLPDILNHMMHRVVDNSNGVIVIANSFTDVPYIITTMSHLIFIDNNIKDVEKLVLTSSGLKITNYNYDFEKMLCVNKTGLWTKLSFF